MVARLILLIGLLAGPAQADCRQALLLALDVSGSVDAREYRLQLDGLAAALDDPQVRAAFLAMPDAPVRLMVMEWSGPDFQRRVVGWRDITGSEALGGVIATLHGTGRAEADLSTAIGSALIRGGAEVQAQADCWRRVIDVSGDGITNDGFRPQQAYAHFPFTNVTVNGLAVLGSDPRVVDYFRGEVVHGPGAFVEVAQSYEDFRRAMTLKLFRELNDMIVGQVLP